MLWFMIIRRLDHELQEMRGIGKLIKWYNDSVRMMTNHKKLPEQSASPQFPDVYGEELMSIADVSEWGEEPPRSLQSPVAIS